MFSFLCLSCEEIENKYEKDMDLTDLDYGCQKKTIELEFHHIEDYYEGVEEAKNPRPFNFNNAKISNIQIDSYIK